MKGENQINILFANAMADWASESELQSDGYRGRMRIRDDVRCARSYDKALSILRARNARSA